MDRVSCRTLAIVFEKAGIPDPALDFALADLPGVAAWLRELDAFLPAAVCVEVLERIAPLVDDFEELRRRVELDSIPAREHLALENVFEAFTQRWSRGGGGAVVDLFVARARLAKQAERLETLEAIGAEALKHVELDELADALIRVLRHRLQAAGLALWVCEGEGGPLQLLRREGRCEAVPDESHDLHTASRRVGRVELWRQPGGSRGRSDSRLLELIPWLALALDNARFSAALREREGRLESEMRRRQEVELQFRQAQKMDALGQLAGGIAHDFNNLLTVITGYGEMLLEQQREGEPATGEETEEILAATKRAAGLTAQLLAFSRRQVLQPRVVDAGDLVVEVARMLRPLVGESIEVVTLTGEEPVRIEADPVQMQQVLLNLAVNARDAMPGGGILTLQVRSSRLTEREARGHGDLPVGARVAVLSVSDNGCGMSEEVQARVFDPFFTTKEAGRGVGLGLSTAYGIVRQSGGQISVETEVGRGTSVRICLPQTTAVVRERVPAPRSLSRARGDETLLVVEDADGLLDMQRRVLESRGYRVLAARTGEEALRLAAAHPGSIPLLLTDVVMPHMSGPELGERLMRLRPDVQVLYVSGYAESSIADRGERSERFHFLAKPFTPEELANKVRNVLDLANAGRMHKVRLEARERVSEG